MARTKGILPISANFEPQIAGPFDARHKVNLFTDLALTTTWQAKDGQVYAYKGMLVVVANDTPEKNGVYRLSLDDYSASAAWVKEGAPGSINGVALVGDKTSAQLGLATSAQGAKADSALAAIAEVQAKLNLETSTRTTAVQNLQSQITGLAGGYLGAIAHNAAAPTPGASGYYEFNTAGSCAWITGGAVTVKIGDRVSVRFTAPSTYAYTYIAVDVTNTDLYNVTVKVPLAAGQFYTATTARAAVPANIRKLGLKITYATAAGVWVEEQFVGGNVSDWGVVDMWVIQPSLDDSGNSDAIYVVDSGGNVIAKIDSNGVNAKKYNICNAQGDVVNIIDKDVVDLIINSTQRIDSLEDLKTLFINDENYEAGFYIVDNNGDRPNVGLKFDENGFDVSKVSEHFKSLLSLSQPQSIYRDTNFYADINMCIITGQSLAMGGATVSENFYNALQFEVGVAINSDTSLSLSNANNETLRQPAFGQLVTMGNGSGLNGRYITKLWNELLVKENSITIDGFNHNLLGLVSGVTGGQWYQLSKYNYTRTTKYVNDTQYGVFPTAILFGSNAEGRAYLNLLQGVYFANKNALTQGKSFNVPIVAWVQGEASSDKFDTVATYENKLLQIFGDLNSDIKNLTGQENDVVFIIYQNSSFSIYQEPNSPDYSPSNYTEGVPLACLKVARENDNVHFACPLYPYSPPISAYDKVHLSNKGYAMMSSHFGVVAKRAITDLSDKKIFYPKNITKHSMGSVHFVRIQFDVPVKPLVFDTTGDDGENMKGHGIQPNYGFSILNNSGLEIISNVRLSADDSVVLTCTENPSGFDITYARTGVYGGGNLRDSQGNQISTVFSGVTYRLDNWCPFFRIKI